MAGYEDIRRRWVTAFSTNSLFGGIGFATEPRRRWSANRRVDWGSSGLLEAAARTSAARMPTAGRGISSSFVVPAKAPTDARVVLSEQIFRDVLVRERKRAERFDSPFAVLVVDLTDLGAADAASVWSHASGVILGATRETDVVGWVTRGSVLGVVLTELGENEEAVARDIEMRTRQELANRLDGAAFAELSLRLHFNVRSKTGGAEGLWPTDPVLSAIGSGVAGRPGVRDVLKRTLDIVGSAALLILLSPVFLAIAALIKLKSPGPIFFRQVRVGQKAQPFTMLKFRSMHVNADSKVHQEYVTQFIKAAEASQTGEQKVFKLTHDPRITPLGHILRQTSLDELPQLWNVLRGDMSLVGPRPPLFYETEQYRPWHWRRVLDAKPGVTGLWQVAGRSRTTFDGMVRLDLRYVRTRSLWTDIKILLATPAAVITGKGAC